MHRATTVPYIMLLWTVARNSTSLTMRSALHAPMPNLNRCSSQFEGWVLCFRLGFELRALRCTELKSPAKVRGLLSTSRFTLPYTAFDGRCTSGLEDCSGRSLTMLLCIWIVAHSPNKISQIVDRINLNKGKNSEDHLRGGGVR